MNVKGIASSYAPFVARFFLDRIERSPTGLRLARGMFWSVAGTVISRGLMLCATVFVARILGRSVYGELGMIRATVGMFAVFAGFGTGLTAVKHVAEWRESDPRRAGRIIGLSGLFATVTGGLMALGLLVSAPWLAEHTLGAPRLDSALRIGSLFLFISALNGAQTGALSGFEAFRTIAKVNLFVGLISFPILVVSAYLGGLEGAMWGFVTNIGVNWLLNHLALTRESKNHGVPLTFTDCGREWGVLWQYSLPAVMAGAMVGPVNWACGAMLVNQFGGFGEMGVFSAADQWFTLLIFLPSTLGNVALPILAGQLREEGREQSAQTMLLAMKINLIIVVPLVLLGSVASPLIMSLYGDVFREGWPTLVVVLVTAGLLGVQMPVAQMIVASGKIWVTFAMNAGWAVAFLIGTALLREYGALGIASARGIAYALHAIWLFAFAYTLVRAPKFRLGSV